MRLRTSTTARAVDVAGHRLLIPAVDGRDEQLLYDGLVIGTGATPVLPPIDGLRARKPGRRSAGGRGAGAAHDG